MEYPENLDGEGRAQYLGASALVTFNGGDTYEGWRHLEYRQYDDETADFKNWESGGYENSYDPEPVENLLAELAKRFISGEVPLPKWTNQAGWDLWLACQTPETRIARLQEENRSLREKISLRNRQIRDLRRVVRKQS